LKNNAKVGKTWIKYTPTKAEITAVPSIDVIDNII
jgi:hypothetical protein